VRPTKPVGGQPVPGLIETLNAGFEQINRIPWILGLPILIDLFLWFAPRLSAAPVIHRLATRALEMYQGVTASGLDPTAADQARQSVSDLDAAASTFNVFSLLVVNVAAVPSIMPPSLTGAVAQEINSGPLLALVVLIVLVVGGLLGCLYLGAIAQQVRDKRFDPLVLARRVWFYWLSVIGFILLAGVFIVAVSIPVGIVVGLAQYAAPGLGGALWSVALTFVQIAGVLFMIYLFFLVYAIVVSEVGPVRAAISSARVVANNFWTSVGFIVLFYVISLGMQVVWTALSASSIGTAAAIAGNAYIESGLAAASMLYYSSRVSRLPAARGVLGRVGVRQE
jgi:hypothetical protein